MASASPLSDAASAAPPAISVEPGTASSESMQSLLTSLLASASPSKLHDVPNTSHSSAEAMAYLRSLSTYSLADLRSQPDLLAFKAKDLDKQLSDLCITQTDAFISLYEAERSFAPSVASLSSSLDGIITGSLPDLERAAAAFMDASKPSLEERKRTQLVVDEYERGALADVLDLPRLVDTCVRARHYPEALQLGEHIVNLTTSALDEQSTGTDGELRPSAASGSSTRAVSPSRHGDVLASLLHEAWAHLSRMKADLIAQLQRPGLQLPTAKRNASLLRKLHGLAQRIRPLSTLSLASITSLPDLHLDDSQLCLCYLTARHRILSENLDKIVGASIDTPAFLRRYIDAWREGLTETLSIANALLSEGVASTAESMTTPAYLLSTFAYASLDRLRETLQVQLPRIGGMASGSVGSNGKLAMGGEEVAAIFAALQTQLSYTSTALARYGLDFGHVLLLPPTRGQTTAHAALPGSEGLDLLELSWLEIIHARLVAAFDECQSITASATASLSASKDQQRNGVSCLLPSSWLVEASRCADLLQQSPSSLRSASLSLRPESDVVSYPPFVTLLNAIMDVFNGLRLFAPRRLRLALQAVLETGLLSLVKELQRYHDSLRSADPSDFVAGRSVTEQQRVFDDLPEAAAQLLRLDLQKEAELLLLSHAISAFDFMVARWSCYVLQRGIFGRDEEVASNDLGSSLSSTLAELSDLVDSTVKEQGEIAKQRDRDAEKRRAARLEREAEEERQRQEREAAAAAAAAAKAEEEARERKRREEEEAKKRAEEERRRAEQEAEEKRLKEAREAKEAAERERQEEAERLERQRVEEEEAKRLQLQREEEEEARRKAEEAEAARLRKEAEEEEERQRREKEAEEAAEQQRLAAAAAVAAAAAAEEAERKRKEEEQRRKEEEERKDEEERRRREEEAEVQRLEEQKREEEERQARAKREQEQEEEEKKAKEAEAAAAAEAEAARKEAAEKEKQEEEEERRSRQPADDATVATAAAAAARTEGDKQQGATATPTQPTVVDEPVTSSTPPAPTAEPSTSKDLATTSQPAPPSSSSSSVKKTNLAEKLRLRKEQREREAAAAAAAAVAASKGKEEREEHKVTSATGEARDEGDRTESSRPLEGEDADKEAKPSAPVDENEVGVIGSQGVIAARSDEDTLEPAATMLEPSTTTEAAATSRASAGEDGRDEATRAEAATTTTTDGAREKDEEADDNHAADDNDDAEDDVDDDDDEASGNSVPPSPAPDGSSGTAVGGAGKKKANKKKKKKKK